VSNIRSARQNDRLVAVLPCGFRAASAQQALMINNTMSKSLANKMRWIPDLHIFFRLSGLLMGSLFPNQAFEQIHDFCG
jgi:hypothetical protein